MNETTKQPEAPARRRGGASGSSFVRMFQPRFAALVEAGRKTQTVRQWPKRIPKIGDRISCRAWTGKPYRSKQRVLCDEIIDGVWTIEIETDEMRIDGIPSSQSKMDAFAIADGFTDWAELCDWFHKTHKLPFFGIVIRWTNTIIRRP